MSDDSLQWKKFKQGDEKALEGIFLLHHKDLFRYGYKIAANRSVVDDCIQDLFLELWQSRARLTDVVSIKAYLFRALKYKLIRASKKEAAFSGPAPDTDQLIESGYETTLVLEQQQTEIHDKLMSHIGKLPPRQQEALYLRYYCQLSYPEISSIMAISIQAVTNLVFKSIKGLRQHLLMFIAVSGCAAISDATIELFIY